MQLREIPISSVLKFGLPAYETPSIVPQSSVLETALAALTGLEFHLLSATALVGFLERRFQYFLVPTGAEPFRGSVEPVDSSLASLGRVLRGYRNCIWRFPEHIAQCGEKLFVAERIT